MDKNKRGLSPIVGTVLIIMITIAAVATIASFVLPFVKKSLDRSTECLPYERYYTFDETFEYNCFMGNEYRISIKSSFDKALSGNVGSMKIILNRDLGDSIILEIKNGSASSIDENGISITGDSQANLRLPGPGGIITYSYRAVTGENFVSAEVYPVLKSGRICAGQKEAISIKPC